MKLVSKKIALDKQRTKISLPKAFNYDTIKGTFYFENYIDAFEVNGGVIAGHKYILVNGDSLSIKSYKNGCYIIGVDRLNVLTSNSDTIVYDKSSINEFGQERLIQDLEDLWQPTRINPYCKVYYKKFYIEAVIVDLGSQFHHVPMLIKDCEEYERYKSKHQYLSYKLLKLPTYGFTQILKWETLD